MKATPNTIGKATNRFLPLFLRDNVSIVIIGDDEKALRHVNNLLDNANVSITHVASPVRPGFTDNVYNNFQRVLKIYEPTDLDDGRIVIIATRNAVLSASIRKDAHTKNKLVYMPHAIHLSDFEFGEIAAKDDIKIAISTTGSNDVALELKDTLQSYLHSGVEEIDLDDLDKDFTPLEARFNEPRTSIDGNSFTELHWKRIASYSILAFFFMILGHVLLSYLPVVELQATVVDAVRDLDNSFWFMVLAGFTAQMIDGALGMGYGVTCTTFLLSMGINLPAISGSIHTAEMFSSAASGYSHYRFGNVNKKLFKALLIPGIIGAVAGAWLLSTIGNQYAYCVRPILASYTLILGLKIFLNAFIKNRTARKVKRVGWLAGTGGFLDSFGGGGWGPLVTSTLIAKGKTPKYVIGTVSLTEFFVTFASALTFFSLIGLSHWEVILGLIVGGVLAAPLAARLTGKLPVKTMFITVGVMVIIWSLRIIINSLSEL